LKFTWEKPICNCDVCVERRSPGEQNVDPPIEVPKEVCFVCGRIMPTFKIQCKESVKKEGTHFSSTGTYDCVAIGKIC